MMLINNIRGVAACLMAVCLFAPRAKGQDASSPENKTPDILFRTEEGLSTSAISSVSGEKMFRTPTTNMTSTLFGLVNGLSVQAGSGEPGDNSAWLRIRGLGTFQSEDSYTVFVDGFQTDMAYAERLLPSDIANVYVLKDGAALSTFGMKGANGVLWIETKRGKPGKTHIDVNFRQGFQRPQVITKPLGSAEYAMYYNEAASNDAGGVWSPVYTEQQIADYRNGKGINTDWYDEVLRSGSSPFSSIDVSFDGGGDNMRFYTSVGYMTNLGAIDNKKDADKRVSNTSYKQYSIRTNFDVSFLKIFEARIDMGGYIADRSAPNYDMGSLFNNLERYPNNIYRPYDSDELNPDGSARWAGTAIHPDNPLASVRGLGTATSRDRSIQANFTLRENLGFLLPGFYLQESVSFSNWTRGSRWNSRDYTRWMDGVEQTSNRDSNYNINDDTGTNQWRWIQFRAQAGYEHSFGDHMLQAAVKYEQWKRQVDANMNQYGFPGDMKDNIQMDYAYQNIAGRLNYSYQDKYVAEFGFAYSGSDNYRKGNRFEFYPSVSGAWILSKENFLADSRVVDLLKLRVSWGQSGYDYSSYGRYLYDETWTWGNGYPIGGMDGSESVWISGLIPSYMANPDLTSERSNKFNVGVDARLFKGLDVTIDAYMDRRSGIVVRDQTYSSNVGITPPFVNAGKVVSRGFEMQFDYSRRSGSVDWSVGAMAAFVSDEIKFNGEIPSASRLADPIGHKIWTYFGYDAIGFFSEEDFNADGSLKADIPVPNFGNVQPGDVRYRDVNGDKIINERDQVVIGKRSYPDMYYSFYGQIEFKGFDLNFIFQGMAGRDVNLLDARNKFVSFENYSTVYANAVESWAYYPEQQIDRRAGAKFPRLSLQNNSNNYQTSSLWIRNGGFLKLRNIELGYSLPESLVKKMRMEKLRVYVNATNLFTISKLYRDYKVDPERLSGYPAMKSINLGITVGF